MLDMLNDFLGRHQTLNSSRKIKRINEVRQGEDGITSVAMLLNYFGNKTNIKKLRKTYSQYANVNSIEDVAQLCALNNLKTQFFSGDYLELKKISLPAIIYWRMKRFVVLLNVDHEIYTVFDPANKQTEYQEYEVECYYCELALQVTN